MSTRFLTLAILAIASSGCDFYQEKKPKTGMAVQGLSMQAPARLPWADHDSAQERSFRLFGRGVSAEKQTRL